MHFFKIYIWLINAIHLYFYLFYFFADLTCSLITFPLELFCFLETAYYRHSEGSTPLVILRPWVLDWQRIESGPTVLKSGTQPTELFTNQSAVAFPVFCIRPRPHVSVSIREFFFFLNEDFSLPHTRKRPCLATKNAGFWTWTPEWRFLKMPVGRFRLDGPKRKLVAFRIRWCHSSFSCWWTKERFG